MNKKAATYEELQKELEEILAKIQNEDSKGNLTDLMTLYEQGEAVLKKMQDYLDNAKNSIKKIQQ